MNETTFADIERARVALIDERTKRVADHAAWLKSCDARLKQLGERTALLSNGVDVARVDRALRILQVQGDPTKPVHGSDYDQRRDNTRLDAVADARRLLTENSNKLRLQYIGVKNYAHFGDQRADCDYNTGPRHGDIVFRIGLTSEARQRDLTPDEIEDALYFLHVWPTVAAAKVAA